MYLVRIQSDDLRWAIHLNVYHTNVFDFKKYHIGIILNGYIEIYFT
jgi:hypothetical protein